MGAGWFDEDQEAINKFLGLLTTDENDLESPFDLIMGHISEVFRKQRGEWMQAREMVEELGLEMREWETLASMVDRRLEFARDVNEKREENSWWRLRLRLGRRIGLDEKEPVDDINVFGSGQSRHNRESAMSYFWERKHGQLKRSRGFDDPLKPGFGQERR